MQNDNRTAPADARSARKRWLVVYGEIIPIWNQTFDTRKQAEAFAIRCLRRGDIVYEVTDTEAL